MNKQALFCDGTENYVIPPEPIAEDTVELLFRTGVDDVDSVELYTEGSFHRMEKADSVGEFDYYRIYRKLGTETMRYYFRIQKGEETLYYNQYGVADEAVEDYDFRICPGFATPEWAKGAVMYQIFTDRFCNGDPTNDVVDNEYYYINETVKAVKDWNQYPSSMDVRDFYGGDLQGVKDKLDYLQDLGVEVIYFNPLFVSPSNHKYDSQDYDYIDPHYGVILKDGGDALPDWDSDNRHATKYQVRVTDWENLEASNRFFAELVEEIHSRGMKVILDGVFNHCGSFNKWMDRECIYEGRPGYEPGAYVSAASPYRSYFDFRGAGDDAWPYNGNYDGWWGHDTLPKLNYDNRGGTNDLEKYILRIGQKWVSPPYNVDGWRLDVAADLGHSKEYNHEFWKKFRKAVKEVNPDALILAEHYGDPKEWLEGDEWDSVMNYDAFMEPVTWFFTGMEKHSDEERTDLRGNADAFVSSITHNMACYMTPSLQTAMNELSNHDHSRFLSRTNHVVGRLGRYRSEDAEKNVNPAVMREAVVVQMTWIGAPTIYYGDEAGVCGFTDPDNRRTYPWGHEDQELIAFHKEMIAIHNKYRTFRTGSLKMLTMEENVLAYGRFDIRNQFVIVVNNSDGLRQVRIPVWQAELPMKGSMRRLMYSYDRGYTTEFEEYLIEDGEVVVNMGGYSALVLKNMEF
ncbi:MAG: glycoside hydrolase family 13 protein [Eubacteriales bacterium]|nr:glycoside hydrolase family 13 protein [Eubacteriales bacterium]